MARGGGGTLRTIQQANTRLHTPPDRAATRPRQKAMLKARPTVPPAAIRWCWAQQRQGQGTTEGNGRQSGTGADIQIEQSDQLGGTW
jgi:hypothetical protein